MKQSVKYYTQPPSDRNYSPYDGMEIDTLYMRYLYSL